MPDNDRTDEAAPASPGRARFRRKAREPEPADPAESAESAEPGIQPEPAPAAVPAKAKRTRRQLPDSSKRLLLIVVGGFVLVASVLGFYLTSNAFDDRVSVLVAARPIEYGETVSAADFGFEQVLVGAIPHVPGTPLEQSLFEGLVAVQPIPAGALVRHDMFITVETVGVQLEVVVPLDMHLATDDVADGDPALLVDPGVEPVEGDDGRPRRVVRQFELTNFDGSQMRLFLPPEEWAQWEALLEAVGRPLIVVDLDPGDDAEEITRELDAVWQAQWAAAVEEVALAVAEAEPKAGPGELEVIVSLDASLVPSGVAEGDLVLLVDPGVAPDGAEAGRRRSVLQTLTLRNYAAGQMKMFVPPGEWVRWRAMPEDLGGTPLILPVPAGSDVDEMIGALDAEWEAAWRNAVAEAAAS